MVHCSLIVFLCVGTVVCVLGLVLKFAVVPPIIEDQIIQNVILKNNTDQWDRWVTVPFGTDFKVYFFNILNGEEVKQGAKPILKEVGPYIYKQYRNKSNIAFEGRLVAYDQYEYFEFDKDASGTLREEDTITILNLPMMAMLQTAELINEYTLEALKDSLEGIFEEGHDLILTTTVRKFLFDGVMLCKNYRPFLPCNIIRLFNSKTLLKTNDGILFSLFEHKHGHHNGRFVVKTGIEDVKQLGEIYTWVDETNLSMWGGPHCNMINGTDTTIYQPLLSKEMTLQIFNTDICRSVNLTFHQETKYKGIKGYEFIAHEDVFAAPAEDNDNVCFCPGKVKGILQENGCLKKGTLDTTPCLDAPVVLSFPHLLWADKEYQDGVIGLNPDSDLHRITLELEPNTGAPLRGGKRAQFNMFIRPMPYMNFTYNLTTTLLPIVWMDESLELPDEFVAEIKESFFDLLEIVDIVVWVLVAIGGALAIAMLVTIVVKKNQESKAKNTELFQR